MDWMGNKKLMNIWFPNKRSKNKLGRKEWEIKVEIKAVGNKNSTKTKKLKIRLFEWHTKQNKKTFYLRLRKTERAEKYTKLWMRMSR